MACLALDNPNLNLPGVAWFLQSCNCNWVPVESAPRTADLGQRTIQTDRHAGCHALKTMQNGDRRSTKMVFLPAVRGALTDCPYADTAPDYET